MFGDVITFHPVVIKYNYIMRRVEEMSPTRKQDRETKIKNKTNNNLFTSNLKKIVKFTRRTGICVKT